MQTSDVMSSIKSVARRLRNVGAHAHVDMAVSKNSASIATCAADNPWQVPTLTRESLTESFAQLKTRAAEITERPRLAAFLDMLRENEESAGRPAPVWFISTGRCGTYSLYTLFAKAKTTLPYHRRNRPLTNRNEVFLGLASGAVSDRWLEDAMLDYLTNQSVGHFSYAMTIKRQFVSVDNHELAWLPLIAISFPQARFVHLVRHPRAVVTSWLSKNIYSPDQIHPVRISGERFDEYKMMLFQSQPSGWEPFDDILWYWKSANLYIENALAALAPDRSALVRSEDLFQGDAAALDVVREFTDLGEFSMQETADHMRVKRNEVPNNGAFQQVQTDNWSQPWREKCQLETGDQLHRYGYMDD